MGNIVSRTELVKAVGREARGSRRVVFTNGCFDLLHPGHVRSLERGRSLGDLLVVGINSDASVRALKGPGRPVVSERERAEVLAALGSVDFVVIFDESTPRELIASLLPDVLVKGADWGAGAIVGREEVEAHGGKVVSIPLEPGYSTSNILEKIRTAGVASVLHAPAPAAGSRASPRSNTSDADSPPVKPAGPASR